MNSLALIDHLYVILVSGVFLMAIFRFQPQLANKTFSTPEKITMYWSNSLFLYLIAIGAIVIWWLQGREFSNLGFCWPNANHVNLVFLVTVVFVVWLVGDSLRTLSSKERRDKARERWIRLTPFMPETPTETKHAMQLALCAGITEEIVFRGFLINYFSYLMNGVPLSEIASPFGSWGTWVAILIPALMFGLSHLYLGWRDVFKVVWLATLFGLIYVLSGSLLLVVILHVLIDVIANLMSPWIMSGGKVSVKTEGI